jgi:hypothetical protein
MAVKLRKGEEWAVVLGSEYLLQRWTRDKKMNGTLSCKIYVFC